MTKTCPSCDVLAPSDARYCRHCGAPLKRLGADDGVSPIATTVPLSGHNLTDEIVSHPADFANASHTSEVSREEMRDLLGRGTTAATDGHNGESHRTGNAHRESGASSTRTDAPHNYAQGDFDPEQTQITINVRPLTSRNLPADAAAAASVATRAASGSKPEFNNAPQQVTLSPADSTHVSASPSNVDAARRPAVQPNERRAFRVWVGAGLTVLSLLVIACVVAALWFGARGFRRATETPTPTIAGGETMQSAADPRQLANAKLVEADTLIASGNANEAIARLREAALLDPSNAEPHRRLARLLLANDSRREAIEELRVVTRLVPTDAEAWRSLASAQFAEGLYGDALESYRGLGEASPAMLARDSVQLAYADTLRLAGRTNEARTIYRRLAENSSDAQVVAASKRHLGQPSPTPTDEETDDADTGAQTADATRTPGATTATREDATRPPETASASPTPPPAAVRGESATDSNAPPRASSGSPSDQYQRGVALWTVNRSAALAEFRASAERGNADASYYLGLSIAEGRDPRVLRRAELVAALVHFGRARRGRFRAQSVTYEDQLGRELDRRRTQQQ
ncbi:MAG TPA: tetratricopeptide repeat protein [Pyrinomonadaceae bacterium]|nr:tetratricopeptide repeat protein [Pyrinomonadaceae bacterium]